MDPDSIIRIHSASDEGAACIQAQPTAPDKGFTSLEFKVFIYLRLGIQISKEDIKCPLRTHGEGLLMVVKMVITSTKTQYYYGSNQKAMLRSQSTC